MRKVLILIVAVGLVLYAALVLSAGRGEDAAQTQTPPPASSPSASAQETPPGDRETLPPGEIPSVGGPTSVSAPGFGGPALLVNTVWPLPADYSPTDLVTLYDYKDRHFELARIDIQLRREVYEAMDTMFAAARREGFSGYIITSGYRDRAKQNELNQEDVNGTVAPPGQSEHETGYAFDVSTPTGDRGFVATPQYTWLSQHCWEYGFILRYPEGKELITGYPAEAWHYRYVGLEAAREIWENDLTLEEYWDALG